jgi:hypothetical protein
MNSENSIRIIDTYLSNPKVIIAGTVVILLLVVASAPIIYRLSDDIENFTHDAMEHGYDIKFKAGPVDIALTKNN